MEFCEFRKLVEGELSNTLILPQSVENATDAVLCDKYNLTTILKEMMSASLIQEEQNRFNSLKSKLVRRCNLTGQGTFENPYHIETDYGDGKFFHFNHSFKKGKVPSLFQKHQCHSNCFEFANKTKRHCTILSGISFRNYSFLHSVLLMGEYILDFNYDIVMSKDLYVELFNFDILNKVDSEDIKKYAYLFYGGSKFFKENEITYGDANFCFYEIVDIIKKEKVYNIEI